MGRTRIALLFNEENEKQHEVCEYLKSQPRCKTALITELVYNWLRMQEQECSDIGIPNVRNTPTNMSRLKEDITQELLHDRDFIEKVMICVKAQMIDMEGCTESAPRESLEENMEPEDIPMDFDEDMLLNGMAMFET